MPKMTADKIEFLPEDRQAISEQSPGITPTSYTSLFNGAIADGDTTHYFKFLEEIHEKDPDIMHTIETRTSYVTSKEWQIEDGEAEEGEEQGRADPNRCGQQIHAEESKKPPGGCTNFFTLVLRK